MNTSQPLHALQPMDPFLTDEQWQVVSRVLPRNELHEPSSRSRRALAGILQVLQTGCSWSNLNNHQNATEVGARRQSVTERRLQDKDLEEDLAEVAWRQWMEWDDNGTWENIWRAWMSTLDISERQSWAQAFLKGYFTPTPRREASQPSSDTASTS